MAEYGSQAVVWQTAVNPVVALELIEEGAWSGAGVLGPEALPPRPFLDLLNDYGSPWACEERTPTAKPKPGPALESSRRGQQDCDQVSARIWLSTLVVFATGSAWRQSCSMTSR